MSSRVGGDAGCAITALVLTTSYKESSVSLPREARASDPQSINKSMVY